MNICVLGGNGLLGKEIRKYFIENYNLRDICNQPLIVRDENKELYVTFPAKHECDIRSEESINNFLYHTNQSFDIIIHAASYTQERCKKFGEDETYFMNCITPFMLCRCIPKIDKTKIIYISTDYVFDGKKGNYREGDTPNPLGFYAKTKWYAEGVFLSFGHKIIRTSFCDKVWPYDKAYDDKFASRDVVSKIVPLLIKCILLSNRWNGILHVGTERKSFYDLAKSLRSDVVPNHIPEGSDVPPDTSFNLTKMKGILGNDYKF